MNASKRGFSLVEILVVVVVLLIIMAVLAPRYLGPGKGPGGKTIESPIQRARSTECTNNLAQLRNAYRLATMEDDTQKPPTLRDVGRGFPESMFSCPIGKQPYTYEPGSGTVACVQPGHERY